MEGGEDWRGDVDCVADCPAAAASLVAAVLLLLAAVAVAVFGLRRMTVVVFLGIFLTPSFSFFSSLGAPCDGDGTGGGAGVRAMRSISSVEGSAVARLAEPAEVARVGVEPVVLIAVAVAE